ncbi:Enhancer of mRNA-decapping protein 4 [Eumeta japonica]|uniref:Enhancer of mRNA-decapping protein 4 n=1 Tax=Eumeta variegata TaxID=151549 RepID=A0A4C1ZIZ6_EUMVA|nr:Enhancer of mRNA-decapping protein 4 [Eumeta japonica]
MTRDDDDTMAYCKSISEFLLPYPVLSFCIVDADEQLVKCESSCSDLYHRNNSSGDLGISPTDYDLHHDIDGMADGCMNGSAEGTRRVRLRLYIVQPKGVQEGQLVFFPPEPSNDILDDLGDLTLGEEAKEPDHNAEDHDQYSILQKQSQELKNLLMRSQPLSSSMINQRTESPLSMPISLNLMTPDAFSSPGKHDDEDPPLALTPDVSKRPSGHNIVTDSKEHLAYGLESVEPPSDVKFTSGGSSPSREVQKIMALDPIYYKEQKDQSEVIEDSVFTSDVYAPNEKNTSLTHSNSETTWPQISMAQINEANQRKASSDKSSSQSLNLSTVETVPVSIQEKSNQIEEKEMTMNLSNSDRNRLDTLEEKMMQLTESIGRIERSVTTHDNGGSACDLVDRALAAHTERTVSAIENALNDGSTRFWDRIARAGEAAGARAAQTAGVNAARALEPLAKALQHELATKLTTTDYLLRDNIEKLVNSKTVLDNLSSKVGSVVAVTARDSFRETVTQTLLPSVETMHAQMFKQINQVFNNGVKECKLFKFKERAFFYLVTACTEAAARAAAERGAAAALTQVTVAIEKHTEALTAAAAVAAATPSTEHFTNIVYDAVKVHDISLITFKSVLEKEMSWFREHTRTAMAELSRAHSPATPASTHGAVVDRQGLMMEPEGKH